MEQKKFINGDAELSVWRDENGVLKFVCSRGQAWLSGDYLIFSVDGKSVIISIKYDEPVEIVRDAENVYANQGGLVFQIHDCFWFLNASAEKIKLGQKQENGLFYANGDKVSFFLKYVGLKQYDYEYFEKNAFNPNYEVEKSVQFVCKLKDCSGYHVWYWREGDNYLQRCFPDLIKFSPDGHGELILFRRRGADCYQEVDLSHPSRQKRVARFFKNKNGIVARSREFYKFFAPRSLGEFVCDVWFDLVQKFDKIYTKL